VTPHERGVAGEQHAASYLEESGYKIVEKNFRSRRGEVDIIAVRGGVIVFCEVKSWTSFGAAELEHAIGTRKRGRIIDASRHFLYRNPWYRDFEMRFDIVLVSGQHMDIRHIEGAFGED